jgi:ATP-binding cassette subfamily C protein CydD
MDEGVVATSAQTLNDWTRAAPQGPAALVALMLLGVVGSTGFAWALSSLVVENGGALAALGLAAALGLRGVAAWGQARVAGRRARRICAAVRDRAVTRVLDRRRGAQETIGVDIAACVDEVEALQGYYARFAPAALEARLVPVAIALAVLLRSPISAAILVATLLPLVAVLALAGGAAGQAAANQLEVLARLSGLFVDRIRALPIILAFDAQDQVADQVAQAADGVAHRTMRVLRVALISSAALEFFAAVAVALTAVYCGFALLGLLPFKPPERLDLAAALYALALAPEFYAPLRRLAAAYHEKQLGEAAAERLHRLVEGEPARPVAKARAPLPAPHIIMTGAIRAFGPEQIGPVDAEIAPQSLAVILGPSGSGKTTLLGAMIGAEPLSAGEIRLNGVAASPDLDGRIAWSGQAPVFAPGSILDNLRAADPTLERQQALAMLNRVGLTEALSRWPMGLDTPLDERGSGLSGGERRRLALARALLKPSGLLVLDEPTAELDAECEAAVIALLREAARTRTVVVATHSPDLAAAADTLVRL